MIGPFGPAKKKTIPRRKLINHSLLSHRLFLAMRFDNCNLKKKNNKDKKGEKMAAYFLTFYPHKTALTRTNKQTNQGL